jgi:hypothetical protein
VQRWTIVIAKSFKRQKDELHVWEKKIKNHMPSGYAPNIASGEHGLVNFHRSSKHPDPI